ncbi:hypothetical protein NIB75_27395 [Bacteroides uniformis]|nr:hypothetical protein [Bacteroides uniformis]
MMNAAHTVANAPEKITPVLVDKLFEYVRQFTGSMRKGYMIYGHSAGGQFVQRFMLFHDSPYVEKSYYKFSRLVYFSSIWPRHILMVRLVSPIFHLNR